MSMTTEKAAAWFEFQVKRGYGVLYKMAAEALREKAERENPKPLTLEEVLEINDPVWLEYKEGSRLYWISDWAQVTKGSTPSRVAIWWFGNECEETPRYDDYGKTWLAYRHKQKEVNEDA